MGWFNKKEKKSKEEFVPSLPKLPKLPEIKQETKNKDQTYKLPSFPNNSIGKKFSQNTIKKAVSGKKEGEGAFKADEFKEDETRMMQKPLKKQSTKEFSLPEKRDSLEKEIPNQFETSIKEVEPIFIRIDKFEDSLHQFEKAKEKISEIEKTLKEINKINEQEEKELNSWGREMLKIKGHIEKIDKELFSKLE